MKIIILITLIIATSLASAQSYNVWDYYLKPSGYTGHSTAQMWNGSTLQGETVFWRGTKWGKTMILQGDTSMTRYDILEETSNQLLYYGSFRGNQNTSVSGGTQAVESHLLKNPFVWMNKVMSVGSVLETTVDRITLEPEPRSVSDRSWVTMRMEFNQHLSSYTIPETIGTGNVITYSDVIKMTFFSNKADASSKEIYWFAKGKGVVRFEAFNPAEPSGVHTSYITHFSQLSLNSPTDPWFGPFASPNNFQQWGVSFARDGSFEFSQAWNNGHASWVRGSSDCVFTTDGGSTPGHGTWRVALRGSTGGGDSNADAFESRNWVPVTSGATYRLSGYIWRVSSSDNAYLDFDDGNGYGGSFSDAHASSSQTHTWEFVSTSVTIPSGVTGVRIRGVRDGSNIGNAYFDDIVLQRTN